MRTSAIGFGLFGVSAAVLGIWYIVELHEHIAFLEYQLAVAKSPAAAAPAPPPAGAAPRVAAPGAAPGAGDTTAEARSLSPGERVGMVAALSGGGQNAGSPVWFSTVPNNPEAAAFQQTLQSVFEEAGWQVKGNTVVGFQMKPGIYVFAADTEPPAYVNAITEAFEAAGVPLASTGFGYRAYYQERKAENPNWTGFEMAEDQTFVLAIGRAPESPVPAQ